MKTIGNTLFYVSAAWMLLVLLQPTADLAQSLITDWPFLAVLYLVPDPPNRIEPLLAWWPVFAGPIGMLVGSAVVAMGVLKNGGAIT